MDKSRVRMTRVSPKVIFWSSERSFMRAYARAMAATKLKHSDEFGDLKGYLLGLRWGGELEGHGGNGAYARKVGQDSPPSDRPE